MAFTRVRGPGITTEDNYRVGIITAAKFVGPIETTVDSDFTNINVTGIGTIDGVKIGNPSGIITASSSSGIVTYYGDASKLTGLTAGQIPNLAASKITTGTVATARLGSGTANNTSFLRGDQTWASNTSTTINNNANNKVITGSGTADTLEAEANLTFDGTTLSATGAVSLAGPIVLQPGGTAWSTTNNRPQIQRQADGELRLGAGSDSSSIVTFYTSPSAGGTLAEKLRITSAGVVDINNSAGQSHYQITQTSGNTVKMGIVSGSDFEISGSSNNNIIIKRAGATRLTVTSSGVNFSGTDYGFGTTPGGTPASKAVFLAIGDSDTGIVQDGDGQLEIWGNAVEVANFNAIDGYTSTKPITTSNNMTMGGRLIHHGDTDTYIEYTNNQIDFQANGSSRLYINQYAAYVQTGFPIAFLSSSGATPNIKSGGTNNQDLLLTTGSGNPTRLQVGSGGDVTVNNGNLIIGTAGKGISFINAADTATGETVSNSVLNDYEEGTWNPGLSFNGGTSGMSISTYGGYYIKIGRLVQVGGTIILNARGSSTGSAALTNLPYVVGNNDAATSAEGGGILTYWASMGMNRPGYYLRGSHNSSTADIAYNRADGYSTLDGATHSEFTNSSSIRFIMTYQT